MCWFPYLIIFYPGNLSVDSYWSLQQILGNSPLNNAHPILYTGFVGIFVKFGMMIKDIEFGIALYSTAQMLILAVIFGGLIEWFRKRGAGLILQVLAVCFFALNPLIAMYSVTMWKDILFSTWIVLFVCFLCVHALAAGLAITTFCPLRPGGAGCLLPLLLWSPSGQGESRGVAEKGDRGIPTSATP